ncbi:MAG: Hsp20/alpha crystallin family protein [Phycisphaerae bacterium]|jgi:HSP20 family protein
MSDQTTIEKCESQTTQPEPVHGGPTFVPPVDIIEQDNELLLVADMPGARPDGLDIHYERGVLTIHGQVAPRQNDTDTRFLLREYGVGNYHRRFEIGEGIDAAKIEADFQEGVLTVHLPKAQALLPRKIAVRSN